jgi:hypothetical protein
LQPACPHEQSMSGAFSKGSHWVLQYLPDVVTHEQTGRAHFSSFAVAISFLLASDQQRVIQNRILDTGEKRFRSIRNTFQLGPQSGNRGWERVANSYPFHEASAIVRLIVETTAHAMGAARIHLFRAGEGNGPAHTERRILMDDLREENNPAVDCAPRGRVCNRAGRGRLLVDTRPRPGSFEMLAVEP